MLYSPPVLNAYMYVHYRFDLNNNAALDEEEFVNGWMQYSKDEDCEEYLFNIKNMVRDDNMLL